MVSRDESIEIICVVGEESARVDRPQFEYHEVSRTRLPIRIYELFCTGNLIKNARLIYQDFLDKKEQTQGVFVELIRDIEIESLQ